MLYQQQGLYSFGLFRFHDFSHGLRFRLRCLSTPLLSYIVLALSSEVFREVASLSHKTLIFHGFQGPTIKFHDPQAWKMKFLHSMAFQVFQHNLCEPRVSLLQKTGLPFLLCHRSNKKSQWYCLCPVKSGKDSVTYGLPPKKIFYFISLWITSRYPSQWLKDIKPKFETIITKNM